MNFKKLLENWYIKGFAVLCFNIILELVNNVVWSYLDVKSIGAAGHMAWLGAITIIAVSGWIFLSVNATQSRLRKIGAALIGVVPFFALTLYYIRLFSLFIQSTDGTDGWAAMGAIFLVGFNLIIAFVCFGALMIGGLVKTRLKRIP